MPSLTSFRTRRGEVSLLLVVSIFASSAFARPAPAAPINPAKIIRLRGLAYLVFLNYRLVILDKIFLIFFPYSHN